MSLICERLLHRKDRMRGRGYTRRWQPPAVLIATSERIGTRLAGTQSIRSRRIRPDPARRAICFCPQLSLMQSATGTDPSRSFGPASDPSAARAICRNISVVRWSRGDFRDHLAVVGRPCRTVCRSNGIAAIGGLRSRLGELARVDFRALRQTDLIETIQRRPVVGPRRFQHAQACLLVLRRLARSGSATIRISSAPTKARLVHPTIDAERPARCRAWSCATYRRSHRRHSAPKS